MNDNKGYTEDALADMAGISAEKQQDECSVIMGLINQISNSYPREEWAVQIFDSREYKEFKSLLLSTIGDYKLKK